MNKTEYIGKLNALYVGEKNCLEELITIYDEKDKEIERLNNIIKEVREYIERNTEEKKSWLNGIPDYTVFKGDANELLEILDKENK